MTPPRDAVYIGHMIAMAKKAVSKTVGLSHEEYDADENLRLALTHLVQIIGEAGGRVSREFCERHPEVPWTELTGMQNVGTWERPERWVRRHESWEHTLERTLGVVKPELGALVAAVEQRHCAWRDGGHRVEIEVGELPKERSIPTVRHEALSLALRALAEDAEAPELLVRSRVKDEDVDLMMRDPEAGTMEKLVHDPGFSLSEVRSGPQCASPRRPGPRPSGLFR